MASQYNRSGQLSLSLRHHS